VSKTSELPVVIVASATGFNAAATKLSQVNPNPFENMKRTSSTQTARARTRSLLSAVAIFTLTAADSLAATLNGPVLDETRTQYALPIEPPVIDGVINVAAAGDEWRLTAGNSDYWQIYPNDTAADGLRGGELGVGALPADLDDLSVKIYVGFDTNNLYVAVRVRDSAIQTDSADADSANGSTWEDDSVEVLVDGENANDAAWAAGQVGGQFVISANNAYREMEAGNPGFGENAAWFAKTTPREDGTGYDAEFRISLAILGDPKPGDVLGFTVAVNDDDDGATRERQVIWVGTAHRPATYGNLVLGPASYAAPPVTTAPTQDGKINAGEYGDAKEIRVNADFGVVYIPGADDDLPVTDLDYKTYVVHDNDAVYIAFDVTDDTISSDTAGEVQGPGLATWDDDSVEIFFDLDNSKAFGGGAPQGPGVFEGQYTLTPKNVYFDGSPSADARKGEHWFGQAATTPTGYQIEFKILKSTLGSPTNNQPIGFHVAINDDDVAGDYSHIGWTGQAHHEYTYGTLTLAGTNAPPTGGGLRIAEITRDFASGNITLRWEGGTGQFQVEKATNVTGPFQALGAAQAGRTFTDTGALRSGARAFYRVREGSGGPVTPQCVTANAAGGFVNTPLANQTGTFEVRFDATPAIAPIDSVMALSAGPRTAFNAFAVLARFNPSGTIDARNGAAYAADNAITYEANVKYTFRLVINIPAHTYSVFVTPEGGTEQTVGTDFAFRAEQNTVTNLDNWAVTVASATGSNTVCNFRLQ
jgi:hypothetical protein